MSAIADAESGRAASSSLQSSSGRGMVPGIEIL
jgi:hypothetical protein